MQGVWVQFLIRALGSHRLQSAAKTFKNPLKSSGITNLETLCVIHIHMVIHTGLEIVTITLVQHNALLDYFSSLKNIYNPVCQTAKETQVYRTVFWTLWERERVG